MGINQIQTETAIRGNGHHVLRGMPINIRPFVCSFAETPIRDLGSTPSGSGFALPGMPSADRSERTQADAQDDNEPDSDPFGLPNSPVVFPEGCIHEADKRWYLAGRAEMLMELLNKYPAGTF